MDTLYFLNGHFVSNAHPFHIECIDLQWDGTVALFSVHAAFNYMEVQFFGNWVSANRVLESQSPAEANSIGDAVSGDFIAQDGWDRQVAKEKMLLTLEKKFLPGGALRLHSIHIWVTSPSVKLIFMDSQSPSQSPE